MTLIRKGIMHQNRRKFSESVSKKNDLYILSAARTPFGLHNGSLNKFTAPQLGSFALREALHRAVVPTDDLKNVFLGCALCKNCHEEVIRRAGLKKIAKVGLTSTCGMEGVIEAIKILFTSSQNVSVSVGAESSSNSSFVDRQRILALMKTNQKDAKKVLQNNLKNSKDLYKFMEQDYKNFIKASKSGAFYDEIIKIVFHKKGELCLISEDEIKRKNETGVEESFSSECCPAPGDGAAALVIATEEYVRENHLTPLAKILSYAEDSSVNASNLPFAQLNAVETALKISGHESEEIVRWEIDSILIDVIFYCIKNLNLNISTVNKDGGFLNLGYPVGMSGVRAVYHLIHSLPPGKLGCAAKCDFNGAASALVIKKLSDKASEKPLLTLYSKKSCSLCEGLKEKLKPFGRQFSLQEVDIEAEENKKYKNLYKYDIPVLFLDGRFLCKYELDVPHFKRRLLQSANFCASS